MNTRTNRRGFTLVELLTVVAIIGILASIVMVAISPIMRKVKQTVAGNDAKQIASAYFLISNEGKTIRSDKNYNNKRNSNKARTVTEWAAVLANKAGLNEGKIWFIESDSILSGIEFPGAIINADKEIVSEFRDIKPKSWAVVANLPTNTIGSTSIPVVWTRGLKQDGTWSEDSPWEGRGGHVAFLDGHVEWFDSGEVRFVNYRDKSIETSNYKDAIGPYSKVLEDETTEGEMIGTEVTLDLLNN